VTRKAKILTTIACVAGAFFALAPFALRLFKPHDQKVAEAAAKAYLTYVRHEDVHGVACAKTRDSSPDGRFWFCGYVSRSSLVVPHPHAICVLIDGDVGIHVKCNLEL
jgi:hypothetical protein